MSAATFELTILGSSSATPIYNRHPTAQILNIHDQWILIDCGEGTQMQLLKMGIKAGRIGHILISHLHGDHYLGLIGLLSSLNLNGRKEDLHVYGPPRLQELIVLNFSVSETALQYNLILHVNEGHGVILDEKTFTIRIFPLQHRIPCSGFLIKEKERARKIKREKIVQYDLSVQEIEVVKAGKDLKYQGAWLPNDELTQAPVPARAYAFCSDTIYDPSLSEVLHGVDTLYHEATFLHAMVARAESTFHTTALQASKLASAANVGKLLIGHFSARYKELEPFLVEAKVEFEATFLALEGFTFLI